jgi:hypothetical protein
MEMILVGRSENESGGSENHQFLIEQYKILSDRRTNHDGLLWQTPVMFFTAQAFLYMIALGADLNYPWWSRAIAAFVSFVFSVLMGLLFENHRAMEISDAEQMLNIENYLINDCNRVGLIIHTVPGDRNYLQKQADSGSSLVRETLLYRKKITKWNLILSFDIWKYAFRFTAYISAFIFMYIIAGRFQFIAVFFYQIDISVKALALLACVLDTLVFLYIKALLPVSDQFIKKLRSIIKGGVTLIIVQNILLILSLILSKSKFQTFLFTIPASNFVIALFFVRGTNRALKSIMSHPFSTETITDKTH